MLLTRALGDGLFELRVKGREGIGKAFFCYVVGKRIIILHGFIKKEQKTPPKELRLAKERLKEIKIMSYKPILFKKFKDEANKNPETKAEYACLEEEFALIAELIKARKMAHKTQQEIAEYMHTSQAMIARLENSFNEKRHSPTLGTVRKYARAVGCRLCIRLVPEEKYHPASSKTRC